MPRVEELDPNIIVSSPSYDTYGVELQPLQKKIATAEPARMFGTRAVGRQVHKPNALFALARN